MTKKNDNEKGGHLNQGGGSERRECIQTEIGRGSHGWEKLLLGRACGVVILEVENWCSLT